MLLADLRWRKRLCCDYLYKVARTAPQLEAFWALRKAIFCDEQKIFTGSDRDAHDETMIPIVCVTLIMGMEDRIVGMVRIDERGPGLWWGSRLGVAQEFRCVAHVSPSVAQRNHHPEFWANRSIGAGLIFKAVSTAHSLGCHTFLAEVQEQNAPFFERLHWCRLEPVERHGLRHVLMQADLEFYPPAPPVEYPELQARAS